MRRVFTIEDKFTVPKGVVLTGMPTESCRLSEGATIFIRFESKEVLTAPMLGFELFRNDWSPHKPRGMAILIGEQFAAHTIPEKAEVWAEDANVISLEKTESNQTTTANDLHTD